ncbi:putative clathrin coat assembly protein [Leptomonas seymouri]|uniref:Putative clathrin coat assembly protein n=1 Tax=Leptomonas seymouri TaxID=5684 RepID=A0A0N1II26_LEPSE|nr:putative clathrin coat assembly protein [Leptomonas seymouri]|eukprot:KPI84353.1 putative clathrin coat assembly protein [Leptomonas seymouri]
MNGTDAKQSAGYFKEKAVIGLTAFTGDEVEKAILKATSHMLKAPKEKYVQKLVAASYGQYGTKLRDGIPLNHYIVRELEKRSHTHNWIVVLKSMVAFHRLLCDASDEMVEAICRYRNIFCKTHLKSLAESNDGAGQAYFIEQYVKYLEERCASQTALGKGRRIEIAGFEEYLKTLNARALEPVFENLLCWLEALSAVQYREVIVNNFCTIEAYQLIVKDGKRLFQLLSKRVIFILDGFAELTLPEKKRWFDLYRRYESAFLSLKAFFDSILLSSKVLVEPVPQLKPLPRSLAARLECEIRASSVPAEAPCTLADLGIRSTEDKRQKAEEIIEAPLPPQAQTVSQPTTVIPPKPAIPSFSMDDLFVSSPEPAKAAPAATAAVDPWAPAPTMQPVQGGGGEVQWDSGAPTGWPTGAPQEWGSGVPSCMQSQSPQQLPPPWPDASTVSPTAAKNSQQAFCENSTMPSATSKSASDPFKSLYDQSHRNF